MKKIGACLLLIGSFLVLSLFTGCQARTVTVDTVLTAVSYTHLDVYKRQAWDC